MLLAEEGKLLLTTGTGFAARTQRTTVLLNEGVFDALLCSFLVVVADAGLCKCELHRTRKCCANDDAARAIQFIACVPFHSKWQIAGSY